MQSALPQISEWELNGGPDGSLVSASKLRALYELFARSLYREYEPTKRLDARISQDFLLRIEHWLTGFADPKDRWAAFRSIEFLLFVGRDEFDELYRCAVRHAIEKWLVDSHNIDIFSSDANSKLDTAFGQCWPCPLTDSLRINSLLHVTGMPGQDLRPDWYSLATLGSDKRIKDFVRDRNISSLVLIEDFVGTGKQFSDALQFAHSAFPGPILAVPLVICARGHKLLESLSHSATYPRLSYEPIVVITEDCLVQPTKHSDEPKLFDELRGAMRAAHTVLGAATRYGEFGYKDLGSLVVLYSNCPDTTPPMYHVSCTGWSPLFPRHSRE